MSLTATAHPNLSETQRKEVNCLFGTGLVPFPEGTKVKNWSRKAKARCPKLARTCLLVLQSFWPTHSMAEAFGASPEAEGAKKEPGHAPLPDATRLWVEAAEDFVALEVVRYLSQFMGQLRLPAHVGDPRLAAPPAGGAGVPVLPTVAGLLLVLDGPDRHGRRGDGDAAGSTQPGRAGQPHQPHRPEKFTPDLAFFQARSSMFCRSSWARCTVPLRDFEPAALLLDPLFHIIR